MKLTPSKALEELRFQVGSITAYTHDLKETTYKVKDMGLFEIIETALKEKENNCEMFKELKELIIDLLVYLDTQLNLNENTIPNSEYNNAIGIVAHLNEKHKDFGNAETRHALLCRIIDNFGVI